MDILADITKNDAGETAQRELLRNAAGLIDEIN